MASFNKKDVKLTIEEFLRGDYNYFFIKFTVLKNKEFSTFHFIKERKYINNIEYDTFSMISYQPNVNVIGAKSHKKELKAAVTYIIEDITDYDIDNIVDNVFVFGRAYYKYAEEVGSELIADISPLRNLKFKFLSSKDKVLNESSFKQYCAEHSIKASRILPLEVKTLDNISPANFAKELKMALFDRRYKKITMYVTLCTLTESMGTNVSMEYVPLRSEYYTNKQEADCISVMYYDNLKEENRTYFNFSEIEANAAEQYQSLIKAIKEKHNLDKIKVKVEIVYNYNDKIIE